ncbi:MAG TPA: carboxypeptidase-like regulatory domain-containing protein [Thermoanaerobaculia bacterium]|jgi:hypothetical protein|nr:carboxypeptidase-like regulatory domain-containing protein [Thermoanaerobaculia bacterium]
MLVLALFLQLVQSGTPGQFTMRLVNPQSRMAQQPDAYPTSIQPEQSIWIWSAQCAPIRLHGALPLEPPCSAGRDQRLRVATIRSEEHLTVRWGTEKMLRELPNDLLPSITVAPGETATLIAPRAERVYARVDGATAASAWQPVDAKANELIPQAGAHTTLRVRADDGIPAAACSATLAPLEIPQPAYLEFRAACNDKGDLVVPWIPAASAYRLRVFAPGLVPRTILGRIPALPSTVELHRGSTIRGRVVGDERKSLDATNVTAQFLSDGEWMTQRATTARDGIFSLAGVPAGSVELAIEHGGYPSNVRSIALDGHELIDLGDVALVRGATLALRILDVQHAPIASATVQLRGSRQKVTTDHRGIAKLVDVPLSGADVDISARGCVTARHHLTPSKDSGPLTVQLDPAAGLKLHVVRVNDHQPVGPGTVLLSGNGSTSTETLSDAGVFEDLNLAPGTYSAEIHVAGFAPVHVPPREVHPGEVVDLGTVTVLTGAGALGTVVDADTGASIPNARVAAVPMSDFGPALSALRNDVNAVLSDAEGRFHVSGLVAGNYALTLDAPRYARKLQSPVAVDEDKDADTGVIRLSPAKTLALHCAPIDACGAEARLMVGGRDANWAAIAAPLYNGEAQLAPVPAGHFLLRLSSDNAVLYEQDIEVLDTSEVTDLDVDLHKTAVSGTVLCNGTPADGGAVVLVLDIPDKLITMNRSSDLGTSFQQNITPFSRELVAAVDGNGRFALSDVAPGSYRVAYRRDAAVSATQTIVVPPDAAFTFTMTIDGATIRGTVLDTGGRPLSDAMVYLFRAGQKVVSAPTMYDGTFIFTGIPPGDAVIRALRQKAGTEIPVSVEQGMTPLRITVTDHP